MYFLNHHMPSVNSFAALLQKKIFFLRKKMHLDSEVGVGKEEEQDFGRIKKGEITRNV